MRSCLSALLLVLHAAPAGAACGDSLALDRLQVVFWPAGGDGPELPVVVLGGVRYGVSILGLAPRDEEPGCRSELAAGTLALRIVSPAGIDALPPIDLQPFLPPTGACPTCPPAQLVVGLAPFDARDADGNPLGLTLDATVSAQIRSTDGWMPQTCGSARAVSAAWTQPFIGTTAEMMRWTRDTLVHLRTRPSGWRFLNVSAADACAAACPGCASELGGLSYDSEVRVNEAADDAFDVTLTAAGQCRCLRP